MEPTLFEAQVRDFVDGGALTVHEGVELIEEELLFGVRKPAALASSLHAAHHVLLRAGQGGKVRPKRGGTTQTDDEIRETTNYNMNSEPASQA